MSLTELLIVFAGQVLDKKEIMKKTKRQRRVKVPALPQVTPRKWSKKTARIFDKQFDRFLYDELYIPTKKAWGK